MGWNTFTGHAGSEPEWVNPGLAHDGDTGTYASIDVPPYTPIPSDWLYLTCEPPFQTTGSGFEARFHLDWILATAQWKVYAEIDEVWQYVAYIDSPFRGTWHDISLIYVGSCGRLRIQIAEESTGYYADAWRVDEAQFYTPEPWPPPALAARTYFFLA